MATIWDFHSVWYRDDLVNPRLKLEELNFRLTRPSRSYYYYGEYGTKATGRLIMLMLENCRSFTGRVGLSARFMVKYL